MCEKRWLNVSEAADYLGVSRQTLYRLMDKGTLPYYTIEGLQGRRIEKEDLDALVKKVGGQDKDS